jgi:sensor domain CHASE-containing protein
MKTAHASDTKYTANQLTSRHWFIAIIGIVIAIVCSLVLLNDIRQTESHVQNAASVTSIMTEATNLKTAPAISILTNFSLQH